MSICFLTMISTSKFPSHPCLRADKGIALHVDTISFVCTLTDNSKLACQTEGTHQIGMSTSTCYFTYKRRLEQNTTDETLLFLLLLLLLNLIFLKI